ncbi:hypothetical protein ES703_72836 [subsurface metagenome]
MDLYPSFKLKDRLGAGGVLLLVLFYFLTIIMVFLPALGAVVVEIMDRPRNIPAITIGDTNSQKHIIMVYHPGASDFTSEVMKLLAGTLAEAGYSITLNSVQAKLRLNMDEAAAVGMASPVYAGTIRPPLEKFIMNNDFTGKRCFLILTGSDPHNAEKDTLKASSLIEDRGGTVVDKVKLIMQKDREQVHQQIEQFGKNLAEKL